MKKAYKVEGVENKNPNQYGGMVSRAIALREVKNIEEGIETIATTEAPAEVIDWERWQIVREILPMRYMEPVNNDKVPLLDSHSRVSVEKVKGSARNFTVSGTELLCKTFISKSEQLIRDKVAEGHIDSVSIGYMTDREYSVEIPKNASVVIDGVAYRNDYQDDTPLVVRTWWKVHELSLVPIGADQAAKFKGEGGQSDKFFLEKIASLEKKIGELSPVIEKSSLSYIEAQVRLTKHL